MIIVYHNNNKASQIYYNGTAQAQTPENYPVVKMLLRLAVEHPEEILVWCDESFREHLNITGIKSLFRDKKRLYSYNPTRRSCIGPTIGYVDGSPFLNVNSHVTYPTWMMSGTVGAVHASVLQALPNRINTKDDLDYFLISLAKIAMPLGLLCYSEPKLLKKEALTVAGTTLKKDNVFRFVKQHYKTRWVFLLLLNLMYYERKIPLIAFLESFFYKRRIFPKNILEHISVAASPKNGAAIGIDVLIPTIGRKAPLYDILTDLRQQTHLPASVIIVEQNPLPESTSDLDYLTNETWPFQVKHTFTHQPGACNARNIGLMQVTGDWVFMADDDIRIASDFLEKALENVMKFGAEASSINCRQPGEAKRDETVFQWPFFGSGCSLVSAEKLKGCYFPSGYEFGFGEDVDFGMQLRNKGCDILYLPEPTVLHLKAPIGGFRTKPILKWSAAEIQPKPSPTIMLYKIMHETKEQLSGYKTTLFLNFYKHQPLKNPIRYYYDFKKRWNSSVHWANQLKKGL